MILPTGTLFGSLSLVRQFGIGGSPSRQQRGAPLDWVGVNFVKEPLRQRGDNSNLEVAGSTVSLLLHDQFVTEDEADSGDGRTSYFADKTVFTC